MTPRPPFDEHDALDPDERDLAARLASLDAGGPSPALDARILAAARAATVRAPARRARRWPTAVGAAATLVVAVGLAWQLKPLVDLPQPIRERPRAAPMDAEVLAQAERVPATAAATAPPTAEASETAAAVAQDRPAPAPRAGAVASRKSAAPAVAAAAPAPAPPPPPVAADDFVDEAVGHPAAPMAASVAAAPDEAAAARSQRLELVASEAAARMQSTDSARVERTALAFGPVADDARLPPLDWLQRIRERRDAGDPEGARESLARFVREYPRHRLPDDLRALRGPAR